MEKVSVILPIYNGEKYLKRCIDSVLKQTYKNIELICINDGSTDSSLKILNSYKDDRIIIIDKKNTGVSDSRNMGIKKSTGKYICFIDDDDTYDKYFVERLYNTISKNNVDVVRCNYRVFNESGICIDNGIINNSLLGRIEQEDIKKNIVPKLLSGSIPGFSVCLFIKKESIKDVYFPTDISMMEDSIFVLRVLLNIKALYMLDDMLYNVTFNSASATNSKKNFEKNINSTIKVNEYIKKILLENNLDTEDNISYINLSHCNAISDFLFKNYLYNSKSGLSIMKSVDIKNVFTGSMINEIKIQRRILLRLIVNKKWLLLRMYCFLRKIIHKVKNINGG